MAGLGTGGMVSSGGALPPPDDEDYTSELNVSVNVARRHIRQALGASSSQRAPHLNPWELRSSPMVQHAARGGFNMNETRNGINLSPRHHVWSKGHAQYNRILKRKIARDWKKNPDMTSQQAAARLQQHANKARQFLEFSARKLGK